MAFVIPTTFTAFDKYSSVTRTMGNATTALGDKIAILGARSERAFNKLPNLIGNSTSKLLSYGKSLLEIDAAIETGKAITDYQTEIQDLSAVTGAAGAQLDVFKTKIIQVADETHTSMVKVSKAFTAVDNNMPELHTDAAGLAEVTKQSIILAQAARMELGPAAESLTMTMNQFGLKSDKAKEVIDALAGGAVAGSSRISETTEALMKFGAASDKAVNITYNEAIALVELASKFEKGAEGGTRMRNILLDMENIKFGSAADLVSGLGVNIDLVSDKTQTLQARLTELSKIVNSPEAMDKVFEKRNEVMAYGLFKNIEHFSALEAATHKVGQAQDMATKNTDTFIVSLQRLRDKFINITIKSNETQGAMSALNGTVKFLTQHLDGLTSIAGFALTVYAGWWAINKVISAVTAGMWLYSAAVGANTFLQGRSLVALGLNTAALDGYAFAANIATGATSVFNAEMVTLLATIGLMTAGLALVIAYHKEISNWANGSRIGLAYNEATGNEDANNDALLSKYKDDPTGTRKFLQDNKKYDTPELEKMMADADKTAGLEAIDKRNQGDAEGQNLFGEYQNQHNGQSPTLNAGDVNIYLTVDKNGNVSQANKNTPGAVQVNVKQTGGYSKMAQ